MPVRLCDGNDITSDWSVYVKPGYFNDCVVLVKFKFMMSFAKLLSSKSMAKSFILFMMMNSKKEKQNKTKQKPKKEKEKEKRKES